MFFFVSLSLILVDIPECIYGVGGLELPGVNMKKMEIDVGIYILDFGPGM